MRARARLASGRDHITFDLYDNPGARSDELDDLADGVTGAEHVLDEFAFVVGHGGRSSEFDAAVACSGYAGFDGGAERVGVEAANVAAHVDAFAAVRAVHWVPPHLIGVS